MLPLWRDQLRIGLSPHAITLARLGKGFRPSVCEKHIELLHPAPQENSEGAIQMLSKLLAMEKWQDANAHVTLSNHFVRYLLTPWNTEINGEQEQTAYVKHRFNKVFGTTANSWALRCSNEKPGMPKLASGIDPTLLDNIRQICAASKLHVSSVQPYLMRTFNLHRPLFKSGSAWFVVVEHGRLTLALFNQHAWQHISTHMIHNENLTAELPLLLDRQLCLSGLENPPANVYLHAPDHAKLALPRNSKWVIHHLQPKIRYGLSLQESNQLALVLGEH